MPKENRFIAINMRLPQNLIDEADALAKSEGRTRSEVFRNALRSYLGPLREFEKAQKIAERRGEAAGINSEEDINRALKEVRARMRSEE